MLISVGVRCLNEEELLPLFLANHQFADEIIICDGGSSDRSQEIATADPKVRWVDFPMRISGLQGGWRNPEGQHVNATLQAMQGQWLWLTEMDAIPTLELQQDIVDAVRCAGYLAVASSLYYIAPHRQGRGYEHYPALLKGPGMTCWHRSLNLRADPHSDFSPIIRYEGRWLVLQPPLARVHLSWRTEEVLRRKWHFYEEVHDLKQKHPDEQWYRVPLPPNITWHGKEMI